ncbi:heme ABC transporter ATP-binding protein [Ursidibacter maritimus]|uniref:Heme ABC transporter ATP-binding protein n=1 Tax=Ursidibacter maritimus TaxID=1331689 RepID=A0A949T3C9_9PAST|nr:heme ABC transporter ATP-binding protein [Ursidibacter maritimus]KAE9540381.1 heme ABC transporter ATP-binding protein [Ursidibacter maritimus]MBV6523495.1 heme ABC transporter ATP-binding protein [Ursidibacter maritimus]MBV6525250.1 heme ABC transporter ATP-binding protein [Ursidibacter maritimus]MBV6528081.1 heme ABC transporter ATP-binding protein [Ursidibacter maritimus]MBV6530353.1 heme ABC transporter ATP-binding protein [Ursidibacter maritimus]
MSGKFSSTSDRLLFAENISFEIQGKALLQNINLVLKPGEITMLIGPNGAGKSTLMRLLSGYLTPSTGQIMFQQKVLNEYASIELAQQRAVMRQHSQLNFPFSVEEVIRMGGYHRRAKEVEHYLPEVIEKTDCQPLLNKGYSQLSGGEQQRTQLARALLQLWQEDMSGKLLFLDEPTSAFDLHHQQQCLRLMRELCDKKGLTVCCILHDLNLASLYGDHIVLLAEQQLQAQGSPKEIITEANIKQWYKADIAIHPHYETNTPQVAFKR